MLEHYSMRHRLDDGCKSGQCNLFIANVSTEDSGQYCCYDKEGTCQRFIYFTVIDDFGPNCYTENNVVVSENSCDIESNSRVKLICKVRYYGNKQSKLRWKYKGNIITSNFTEFSSNGITTNTLTVELMQDKSQQLFTCETVLSMPKESCNLTVVQLYAIASKSSLHLVGGNVVCNANANVKCSYEWIEANTSTVVQMGADMTFESPRVSPGEYKCTATCQIQDKTCRIQAMTVIYSTIDDNNQIISDYNRLITKDLPVFKLLSAVELLIIVLLFVGIVVILKKQRRLCFKDSRINRRNSDAEDHEMTNSMNNIVHSEPTNDIIDALGCVPSLLVVIFIVRCKQHIAQRKKHDLECLNLEVVHASIETKRTDWGPSLFVIMFIVQCRHHITANAVTADRDEDSDRS
jgi:hypothetical protein